MFLRFSRHFALTVLLVAALSGFATGPAAAAPLDNGAVVPAAPPGGLNALASGLKGFGIPGIGGGKLPVLLDADTLTFDEDTGVAEAEGHIVVSMGDRKITADRIRYDSRTQEAELSGSVRFKNEGDDFAFDRIVINIDTEMGILYNGTIHLSTNNYRIASERIEKTGPQSFFIRKGSLTSCDCDPIPDWNFEVRRSRVTIDGYAIGKDVTFKVRDMPVLWLPWAAFPVKLTRQSGFLMPGYLHSRKIGNGITLPWYQVINKWSDATLTLDAMDRRGLKTELEYRFVLNPASEGGIKGAFLHDRETGSDLSRVYGENIYRSGRWDANGRWDIGSDAVYYRDFVEDDLLRTARHIPSRGFAGQTRESSVASLSVSRAKDIQDIPGIDNTVQRLPELVLTALPERIGGAAIGVDGWATGGAAWLYRRGAEREARAHGLAELSRTVTLYPSVFLTPYFAVDGLESRRSGGPPRQSDDGGGRIVPMGGAQLSATVWRYFATPSGGTLVHSVNPSVKYLWVPTVSQDDIPITDQWSRIDARKQATFSISQGLHRIGSAGTPTELASLDLEWAYDAGSRQVPQSPYVDPLSPFVWTLRDQIDLNAGRPRDTHDASDILARLRVNPAARWKATGEALFDPNTRGLTSASIGAEWRSDDENRTSLDYRISRGLSEDIHGQFGWRIARVVGLLGNLNYSIRNKEMTEGAATVNLYPRSDCWNVGFTVHRTTLPSDTSIRFVFGLKGIGGVGK
jgi:LPS-assembly protein